VRTVGDIDWKYWNFTERATLCFLVRNGLVLLIHKKTGLGAGKINGPGGRIEKGETPAEGAVRELQEEVGLTPADPKKYGELSFIFENGYSLHGTVFVSHSFTGTMTETEEAKPFWCDIRDIPYDRMWKDDPYWLPFLLTGRQIRAFFIYNDDTMQSSRVFIYGNEAVPVSSLW